MFFDKLKHNFVLLLRLAICYYNVKYAFQSESTLFLVRLKVMELLDRGRRYIWSLSDSNAIRTHNHSGRKRTLSDLAKL